MTHDLLFLAVTSTAPGAATDAAELREVWGVLAVGLAVLLVIFWRVVLWLVAVGVLALGLFGMLTLVGEVPVPAGPGAPTSERALVPSGPDGSGGPPACTLPPGP